MQCWTLVISALARSYASQWADQLSDRKPADEMRRQAAKHQLEAGESLEGPPGYLDQPDKSESWLPQLVANRKPPQLKAVNFVQTEEPIGRKVRRCR